jgi:hypothetical protein
MLATSDYKSYVKLGCFCTTDRPASCRTARNFERFLGRAGMGRYVLPMKKAPWGDPGRYERMSLSTKRNYDIEGKSRRRGLG